MARNRGFGALALGQVKPLAHIGVHAHAVHEVVDGFFQALAQQVVALARQRQGLGCSLIGFGRAAEACFVSQPTLSLLLGYAIVAAAAGCLAAYRRFDCAVLKGPQRGAPLRWNVRLSWPWAPHPARAAVYRLTSATLRRSGLHQLVVLGTFSAGTALAVNNLTDHLYYNYRSRCSPTAKSVYPEAGRALYLSAQRRF